MKTVLVFTSTRADYGLLKPLVDQLSMSDVVQPLLFVAGTHLSSKYGLTINEIKKYHPDFIAAEVEHALGGEDALASTQAMSDSLAIYAREISRIKPDFALVLGDRYEALSFGLACATLMVPIFHIHGGELTYGAIDDKFRHCLTKLSEYHFTACEKYRARVLQLGEAPSNVFNVGALGVDNAIHFPTLSLQDLEKQLGVSFSKETYLMTFHPETNSSDYGLELLKELIKKLQERISSVDASVIITGVNSDAGAHLIRDEIEKFVKANPTKVYFYESLGITRYLSSLKYVTAAVGNSSSGVLEAYSLGTPSLNIGSRQDGRERETSVIDLSTLAEVREYDFSRICGLKSALLKTPKKSIFGNGESSALIKSHIENIARQKQNLRFKKFFDLI